MRHIFMSNDKTKLSPDSLLKKFTSKESQSDNGFNEFLNKVKPSYAIISVGVDNKYYHLYPPIYVSDDP